MTTVAEFTAKLGLIPNEAEWEHGDKLVEHLKVGLEALGIYEAVEKLKGLVEGFVTTAVESERLAQKLGLSTEAVQELGYAAKVTGANGEELQVGFQHLARGLEELRSKGTGPAADALRALKIPLHDSEVQHGKLDQVLEIVANRFAAMPDGVAKTASAIDLFGRSGTSLIPLLNKGAGGIKELREEAEKLGIVIDENGIKKSKEFEEQNIRLHETFRGISNQIVAQMLPALNAMLTGLLEWVKSHKALIALGIEYAIKGVTIAFKALATAVGFVADVIQYLVDHAELARDIFIAIGLVLLDMAADAVIAWLAVAGPIVLVIAAITGVVAGVKYLSNLLSEAGLGIADVFASLAAAAAAAGLAMVVGLGPVGVTIAALIAAALELTALWDDITSTEPPGGFNNEGEGHETYEEVQARYSDADVPASQLGKTAASGGNKTEVQANTTITQHIHASDGMDSKELASHAASAVDDAIAERNRNAFDAIKGGQR